MTRFNVMATVGLLSCLLCGCETKPATPVAVAPPSPPPLASIAPPPPVATVAPPAPVAPAPEAVPVSLPATPEMETVKAEVGVGKKGRSLDEHEGLVVTPVKSLFAVRERLVFEDAIPYALALFNASEGRFPKSHEEFWEKIVKANNLEAQMPELPAGQHYQYDPESHELMVVRPKAAVVAPPAK